jgi:hypothetical protein
MLTIFYFCCSIDIGLGQSSELWRVLADIMQMQVRTANIWNDSSLRFARDLREFWIWAWNATGRGSFGRDGVKYARLQRRIRMRCLKGCLTFVVHRLMVAWLAREDSWSNVRMLAICNHIVWFCSW